MLHRRLCFTTVLLFQLLGSSALAQTPRIATSILPLQLLVRAITGPANPPVLILPANQSPHDHLLRPSEMRTLRNSDLVFWIGPKLEGFLVRPLAALPENIHVVSLQQQLLQSHGLQTDDPHLWLDPILTLAIVEQITTALSAADPAHAHEYQIRAHTLQHSLRRLDQELTRMFKPVQNIPFIVYHDGYQHLILRYGLKLVTSVSRHPEQPVSLQRMQEIRHIITQQQVSCLFSEPQFPGNLLQPLLLKGVKIRTLDPLGVHLPANKQTYEQLLRAIAINLSDCLSTSKQALRGNVN